jgi:molecular chaperone GrpE
MQINDADQADEEGRMVDRRASAQMGDNGETTSEGPAKMEEALAAAKAEAAENYKNWQRSAADFINYKRRVEHERSETARLASAALVINLLPIYDDMDRAVHNVDADLAGLTWVQGIIAIQKKFGSLLESMGISEVAAEGEAFDPERHEAVGRQPGEEGKVLHTVQKGYQLGDRVIRPAMVIVGEGNAGEPETHE